MKCKKNKSENILLISALILILIGSTVFLYPKISNYLAKRNHVEAIRTYDGNIAQFEEENLLEEWEKALQYNQNLSGEPLHDPFVPNSGYALPENYTEVLNITEDGVMAYIEIPKISVYLPIYHGTSSKVLEKGVGHIETTSLPIGGVSTHCVLTGHTGLASAELFTRINELEVGDIFHIHTLDNILTYKVYETKVVLPDEVDELQITSGKDYVTLVTCTPYGVNTHRLLVKAERTIYEDDKENTSTQETVITENTSKEKNYYLYGSLIGGGILIIVLISTVILYFLGKKRD